MNEIINRCNEKKKKIENEVYDFIIEKRKASNLKGNGT